MVILVTDTFTTESLAQLKQALPNAEIVKTSRRPSPSELANAQVMLIRSRTEINKELLAQAPKLKVVVTATSGFDHIDAFLCKERNIATLYTPDANANAAAELTLMLILSTLRRASELQAAVRKGEWKDAVKPGLELNGKTLGLVGLGRVGSRVAKFAQSFGANICAHDPYQRDEVFAQLKIERLGFTEVLTSADILSLHVPLSKETKHFINARTLEQAKDGLILINTSRGPVVDERALMASLESGEVAAAGLDVFEVEPLSPQARLRKFQNVVMTPHVGAHTEEALFRASQMAVEAVVTALMRGEFQCPIPLIDL